MGKLHVHKSTVVDEKSGNSALVFRIYRFKFIIDVLFRQEHNALKYRNEHTAESRTVVKTQQN